MAASRIYRDYILDESVAPRRSPTVAVYQPSNPTASPTPSSPRSLQSPTFLRATTSDSFPDNNRPTSFRGNVLPIGIAQSGEDDWKEESLVDSGTGTSINHTEDGMSQSEAPEPVLYPEQMDFQPQGIAPAVQPYAPPPEVKRSVLTPSVTSLSEMSLSPPPQPNPDSLTSRPSNVSRNMPEFFSHATFHIVLHNPSITHQLLKFARSRLSGENIEFLARVAKYYTLLGEVSKEIYDIHKGYIATSAPNQINLSENLLTQTNNNMKAAFTTTLPALENIFIDAQNDIERLVYTDIYPNFVRQQMSLSAARALGSDRSKYGGLGDCFVLTDPQRADNPIMYASDGFVKVTGYQRNEIIPRNCRFLQCRTTDRAAVKRLRESIANRHESVELLLNEKKNGEPFWNLLYTTPLYDGNGNLVFFLGGQVNCSTTIHNASDVLRILGQSKEVEAEQPRPGTAGGSSALSPPGALPLQKTSRSRTLLNAFRGTTNSRTSLQPTRTPGMENTLLERIEDQPLKSQFESFYTAYSHYIIVNYSSFLITFISSGIVDLLFPINIKKTQKPHQTQAIGSNVFTFLSNHGTGGNINSAYKSTVKGALRQGMPVSLELKLCARPYMGFENFVCHWTPLKDERGNVVWVVLTLGNERRAWKERPNMS